MAVDYLRGSKTPAGLVADRHLYLDATGNKIVEEGDASAASQFVARGHPIAQDDADRLGLVVKNGKVVQDHAATIKDLRALAESLDAERAALAAKIEQYRTENAVKDIPNTMEAERVALETRYEAARLALAQSIKADAGKDPLRGESQATSVEPETSTTATAATTRAAKAVAESPTPEALAAAAPKTKRPAAKRTRGK